MFEIKKYSFLHSEIFLANRSSDFDKLKDFLGEEVLQCADYQTLSHPVKQLEFLNSRALLKSMCLEKELNFEKLTKDEFGKPYLSDHHHHISLSHQKHWSACMFSPQNKCGIDVENSSRNFAKVSPRVLSETELPYAEISNDYACVYWSAKEAIYKLYGEKQLDFKKDIVVNPFILNDIGFTFNGHVQKNNNHGTFQIRLLAFKIDAFTWCVAAVH